MRATARLDLCWIVLCWIGSELLNLHVPLRQAAVKARLSARCTVVGPTLPRPLRSSSNPGEQHVQQVKHSVPICCLSVQSKPPRPSSERSNRVFQPAMQMTLLAMMRRSICPGTAISACACLLSARAGGTSARLNLHTSLVCLQRHCVLAVSQPSPLHSDAVPAPCLWHGASRYPRAVCPSCILVSLEACTSCCLCPSIGRLPHAERCCRDWHLSEPMLCMEHGKAGLRTRQVLPFVSAGTGWWGPTQVWPDCRSLLPLSLQGHVVGSLATVQPHIACRALLQPGLSMR